ncbi:MAG TPA: hypothetical protein PKN95_06730 [Verrucomicrobiota bacterium]|nr:hypothetical protein [Verrucomicrobiota bacterium]HNT14734.1 hypothetical protein [Verrucomicrobiota bacterium]
MKTEMQLKLQAYLDGELPASESRGVRDLLANDREARELLTELSQTRDLIAAHEAGVKLPETREFYWAKIQRAIAPESQGGRQRSPGVPLLGWWRRILVSAGAVAAVAIAVLLSWSHATGGSDAVTISDGATLFTYRNYATDTTLVWLDYGSGTDFSNDSEGAKLTP